MKEAYVSYETAKLLKEKGFDEETNWYYNSKGSCEPFSAWVSAEPYDYSPMPTHQMACAWLREKGIECVVIPIWNTISKQYRSYVLSDLGDKYKDNYDSYSDNISYEDAVEAALKYSLENLI